VPILTNRWIVLALLFFARASMAVQFQSIPPISTLLVEELGFNFTQIGLLIGLFMFPGVFIALPGGLLGQRIGDKAVVLAGLLLQVVGALVLANAAVFPMAFAGRLIGGIGAVILNVQLTKIINDWFASREIATSMGILMTAWPFGIALAFSTLGYVATSYDWRTAIYLTAVYSSVSLALVALFYHNQPTVASKTVVTGSPLWTISPRELTLIISAGLVWGLPNAGFIVLVGFMPTFLVSNGMEMVKAGMLVSLISWITIGSIPLGGWLTDRTGRINAFIIGGVLLNALFIVILPLGISVLGCILLLGLTLGGWPGAIMALPSQVLSPQGRSTGFGVFYMVYYGIMAALPPVAGWLRDFTGEATASVLFGGVLMALTVAALAAFRILQRRWPAKEPGQLLKSTT
jgi:MFS family permease